MSVLRARALLVLLTSLACTGPAGAEQPSASEALDLLGLSADREQIMAGKIASRPAKPSNSREVAVNMAFLVRESPAKLVQRALEELLGDTGSKNLSSGVFHGEGKLADLAALGLMPNEAEHELYMPEGDGFAVSQRQFYVSRSYNVEQAIAAFIPVSEGTLVAYTNRTSTDKVEGFGGSTKRSIGSKLMARQLSSLYERVQKDAEK